MQLFLEEKMVTKNTLTPDGVLTYIALKKIMDESIFLKNREITEDCVSVMRMAFSLVGFYEKYPRTLTDALQRGIYELIAEDKITIIGSFNKGTEFILNMEKIYFDTSNGGQHFVKVSSDEVRKILVCDESMKKKIWMLKYYVALVDSFDWSANMKCKDNMPNLQGKIGHMTQSYISSLAGISEKTCQRYNVILEDKIRMIYVYRSNDKIRADDSLRQITNCYSRYADKEICKQYATDFEDKMGYNHRILKTKKNKEQADNNRRLAQVYNRICEGYGDKYDESTVRKVFKYITNKNKMLIDEIGRKEAGKYLTYADREYVEKLRSQIRNTVAFEQFPYLYEEVEEIPDEDIWGEPDAVGF